MKRRAPRLRFEPLEDRVVPAYGLDPTFGDGGRLVLTDVGGTRTTTAIDVAPLAGIVELAHHNLDQGTRSLRAAHAAGVPIALGSDRDGVSGDDTALEFARMVHHGLSTREALLAATSVAARAIGLEDHIGTVEPGKLADLTVLDGDLLQDPSLLRDPARVWLVLQLGEVVAGAALEAGGPLAG